MSSKSFSETMTILSLSLETRSDTPTTNLCRERITCINLVRVLGLTKPIAIAFWIFSVASSNVIIVCSKFMAPLLFLRRLRSTLCSSHSPPRLRSSCCLLSSLQSGQTGSIGIEVLRNHKGRPYKHRTRCPTVIVFGFKQHRGTRETHLAPP